MACKTSSSSGIIWLNKTGTFGVASPASGGLHKLIGRGNLHKFRAGFQIDYGGFWMDYSGFEIGLSETNKMVVGLCARSVH